MLTHSSLKVILYRYVVVFIRAIGPKMKVFILRYFIVAFNFFLVLIFSVVGQRERDREVVWLRNPLFLLQGMIETGTEKVFYSQTNANEEWQLLYRLTTQIQWGWERLEQHLFSLASITQQVQNHRPDRIESNCFYGQLFVQFDWHSVVCLFVRSFIHSFIHSFKSEIK